MPDLFSRLEELMNLGRGYIALPGGTGTLIELAVAWERINKGLDKKKPVIVLGDHWLPSIETVKTMLSSPGMRENSQENLLYGDFLWKAKNAEEAVEILKNSSAFVIND